MSPPRICVITTSYPRGTDDDASVFVRRVVDALASEGASGIVLVPDGGHRTAELGSKNFTVDAVRYGTTALTSSGGAMPTLMRKPWLAAAVPALLYALRRAAINARDRYESILTFWLPSAWVAAHSIRGSEKRYIASILGSDRLLLRLPLLWRCFAPALRRAYRVIPENDEIRGLLLARFPELKPKLGDNQFGVDIEEIDAANPEAFAERYGIDPRGSYAAFVGRIVPEKGVHVLIEALPMLPDITLLACGRLDDRGYALRLSDLARSLAVTERVRFLGAVPPREVYAVFRLSRVYLSASATEGRPNAVIEALAARCPAVLSDIPGHREVSGDGSRAMLFAQSSAQELAGKVAEVLRDRSVRERMTAAGREYAAKRTWRETGRRYIELLG